jgi:hypothetical protein
MIEKPQINQPIDSAKSKIQSERQRSRQNRIYEKDLQDGLRKMNEELRKKIENIELQQVKTKVRKNRYPPNLPSIDITIINTTGFHRNLRKKGTVAFSTSLYEIDRLIEEK